MDRVKRNIGWMAAGLLAITAGAAQAQETTTYTYDAKGRLQTITRNGGPANGTTTNYAYDAADNRSNVTVSNSPNGAAGNDSGSGATAQTARYVIVPLNGYTLIKTGG